MEKLLTQMEGSPIVLMSSLKRRSGEASIIFWVGAFCCAALLILVRLMMLNGVKKNGSGEVAQLRIVLNGVSLSEIDDGGKNTKYEGNNLTLYMGEDIINYGGVRIKGRGNSTWKYDKKAYQIKLLKKSNLLGLGYSKKWALISNYIDKTNLKNDVAYELASMLEEQYALSGEFIELYVNDDYRGLYYIMPTVRIGKNEIDLREPDGVIVELDNAYYKEAEYVAMSAKGDQLVLDDVVTEDDADEALANFIKAYNGLEAAAEKGDWGRVQELIDVDSFVKYFLVSEFAKNPDAYSTSFHMYKDGKSDKIHAGPVWDFDGAFAHYGWHGAEASEFYSPTELLSLKKWALGGEFYDEKTEGVIAYNGDKTVSHIMFDLLEIPEFCEAARKIWLELMSGRKTELVEYIRRRAEEIATAAERDAERWEKGGFSEAVEGLVEWVEVRYDYFDKLFCDEVTFGFCLE